MQQIDPDQHDYHIVAASSRTDDRTRVIKHGESFGVFDSTGMIRPGGFGELGVYHDGTRFLSRFEVVLARRRPLLLGSSVRNDGVLVVDLANGESTHANVTSFLWTGAFYSRISIHNYAREQVELDLAVVIGADFFDVFEVRGIHRDRRGTTHPPIVRTDSVDLGYTGLDGVSRITAIDFSPRPRHLSRSRAEYVIALGPDESTTLDIRVRFGDTPDLDLDTALARACTAAQAPPRRARIGTTNERFGAWLERSASDLQMMVTDTKHGPYPYAGVPWFSTPFGRDGIIAAYEVLWSDPDLARGVLSFLAATQASQHEPERDAEPGKIVHEFRLGEMAALGEIPFGRYYGSIDSTPLFVILAGEYWQRTADRNALAALWPHVERALAWIENDGDVDGDGFVEYAPRSSRGLVAQGWKDSNDSISHADGTLAEGPVALCEVQGYVYAAYRAAATMCRVLDAGDPGRYDAIASKLRERFEQAFWLPRLGTYAIALDGKKRPCEVRSSNAGHCLWTGIADPRRAAHVADGLLAPSMFTGWGIRTLDATAARFSPISYHNGSVWPHDNALVAMGLARYGFKTACAKILDGLFSASHYFDLGRMPELFCGFSRREYEGPTLYPVACAPQAWAAGGAFLLLQACLGLSIDAPRRRILLDRPLLPACLEHLTIRELRVGDARLDLACHRRADDVSVQLERRDGDVEICVLK